MFLHKNKWTFLCETGKIGTPVSRKRVSFTQNGTVSRFTVNLRKNKWTFSKCQLLCSQCMVSFTQKRSNLLPSWLWDGKFYHEVEKKRKFDRNCWIHGKIFNHEIASFTKWNWKKSKFCMVVKLPLLYAFLKNQACFQTYPSISGLYRFCETGVKYIETDSKLRLEGEF